MKRTLIFLSFCCIMFTSYSCKKEKIAEIDKLPPATQTGANTFGCLVNGKAWVAQTDCKFLCDPSFKVIYDPNYGGFIGLDAKWENDKSQIDQKIDIIFDSSNFRTEHLITINNRLTAATYKNYKDNYGCKSYDHYDDSTTIHAGKVSLTTYNLQTGIISGIFEFIITKQGCQDIIVTEGRFDYRLF